MLKRGILLFLLFLVGIQLSAQYSGGWQNDFYVPFLVWTGQKDTITAPQKAGTVVYMPSTGSLYLKTTTGWQIINVGSGASSSNADSLGHQPANYYLNNLNDSFAILTGDSAFISALRVDTIYGDYVDSMWVINKLGGVLNMDTIRYDISEYVPYSRELNIKYTTDILRTTMVQNLYDYKSAYFSFYTIANGSNYVSQLCYINNYSNAPTSQAHKYFNGVRDSILSISYKMKNINPANCKIVISLFTEDFDTLFLNKVLPNSLTQTSISFGIDDLEDSLITINKGTTFIVKDSIFIATTSDSVFLYDTELKIKYSE